MVPSVWLTAALVVLFTTSCTVSQTGSETPPLLQPTNSVVSLNGTASTSVRVQASGAWSIDTDDGGLGWLHVKPREGFGNETITVSADRTGITPRAYKGVLRIDGSQAGSSLDVLMRFPQVSGSIMEATPNLSPTSLTFRDAQKHTLGTAGVDRVPGELLVELDTAALAAVYQPPGAIDEPDHWDVAAAKDVASQLASDHGLNVVRMVNASTPVFLLAVPEQYLESAVIKLQADARIVHAEPNGLYQPAFIPSDPRYGDQSWHYEAIGLPEAWDISRGDTNVTVAVIDSGFDTQHPDLVDNFLPGLNFATRSNTANLAGHNCAKHGTHVAGTIAALDGNGIGGLGVAPNVKILPLAIGTPQSDGSCPLSTAAFMEAVRYASGVGEGARETPVDVINLSLGGSMGSFIEARALSDAVGNGVVVVASSGNDGVNGVLYPAAYASTVAVGATTVEGERADYSNGGVALDVMAPGGTADSGVFSTFDRSVGDGYAYRAGTSMAAPHVAGVSALMRSVNPRLSVTDVRTILEGTSTDLGPAGWDPYSGYGSINAFQALTFASEGVATLPDTVQVDLVNVSTGHTLQTVTDANGVFVLKNVPEGTYKLKVRPQASALIDSSFEWLAQATIDILYTGDVVENITIDPRR